VRIIAIGVGLEAGIRISVHAKLESGAAVIRLFVSASLPRVQ